MMDKRKIIMWDDVGFWFGKPDSKEKIKRDLIKLIDRYIEQKSRFRFTSVASILYDLNLDLFFLFEIINLVERFRRIEENE